jgi:hypothetical protein
MAAAARAALGRAKKKPQAKPASPQAAAIREAVAAVKRAEAKPTRRR